MKQTDTPLLTETLEPRHFAGLGLTRQRLLNWFAITGLEPKRDDLAKHRKFSPANVFSLGTLKELKEPASVSFGDLTALVAYVGSAEVALGAVDMWRGGRYPTLVTDLVNEHALRASEEIPFADLLRRCRQLHLFNLSPIVEVVLEAMLRGGNAEQRDFAAQATADHAQALRAKEAGRNLEVSGAHTQQEAFDYLSDLLDEPEQQHLHVRWS